MATSTGLLTVEEFQKLEAPPGCYLELHGGEPVPMTFPKMKHQKLQYHVQQLLLPILSPAGAVTIELGFSPRSENELRRADVALVSWERWRSADSFLQGSPELVIEVVSPSNTARDLKEKAQLCLETGCLEFWTVYPDLAIIDIATPDGHTVQYKRGDIVKSLFTGERSVSVDDVFAE